MQAAFKGPLTISHPGVAKAVQGYASWSPPKPFGGSPCFLAVSLPRLSKNVGLDNYRNAWGNCRNVIIPLLFVLSCGHSDHPGEAGQGVPAFTSEIASFLRILP